jgi:hypothetical protein
MLGSLRKQFWPLMRRLSKFLDEAPPLYQGGTFANLLGLQLFRIAWLNASRLWAPRIDQQYREHYKILQRDGIVIIPDFLPREIFAELRDYYQDCYARRNEISDPDRDAIKAPFPQYFTNVEEFYCKCNSPITDKNFSSNQLIVQAVTACTRPMPGTPSVWFWSHRKLRAEISAEALRSMNPTHALHSDVPYPSMKAFFYLSDVDARNGAFSFAPGSHRLTFKRLKLEYRLSTLSKRGRPHGTISEAEAKALGFSAAPVCGKANTLIIFNAMGFHKRGDLHDTRPRETLHMDFRFVAIRRNAIESVARRIKLGHAARS